MRKFISGFFMALLLVASFWTKGNSVGPVQSTKLRFLSPFSFFLR